MRRFITSLPGKLVSHLVVLALLLPSISIVLASRAFAQVAVLPTWAVVEFTNLKSPGTTFGKTATSAVIGELQKSGEYDVVPAETVERGAQSLGIALPPQGQTNLLRLAQEVRASTVVDGQVAGYKVNSTGSGKQAEVQLRVVVYDVASGIAINGTFVSAKSTIRPGDVSDETLINDAIQTAARDSIKQIRAASLPVGTVLNTTTAQALINKGTRSGFKTGQEVIVLRNGEQVASGSVAEVEPDSSYINVERGTKGVQPGDKVRVITSVPDIIALKDGSAKQATKSSNKFPSSLLTVILIVGLIAILVGGANGSDSSVVSDLDARASLNEANQRSVKLNWSPNGFAKGNYNREAWQIWRSDVLDSPVLVVKNATEAYDGPGPRTITYTNFNEVGGITCDNTSYGGSSEEGVLGVTSGRPYTYQVELVYSMSSLDLPGGNNTGSTASGSSATGTSATGTSATGTSATGTSATGTSATGTSATGTSATGTSATGTSATGTTSGSTGTASTCYFLSTRTNSSGTATPLDRPILAEPSEGQGVGGPRTFTFQSVVGQFGIQVEYCIQFSSSASFNPSNTVTLIDVFPRNPTNATGTIVTRSLDTRDTGTFPSYITGASQVFWRIGARNPLDKPGPVEDPQTKQKFIFSQIRSFVRPGGPPGGP